MARTNHAFESVTRAVRRNSTAAVLFHGAVAEKFRLATTDMKTMEVLDRLGPLTAGELAEQTGLARTSVTALARFLDGLVVAVERGTPLADLLRAQASDVRESAKLPSCPRRS